MRIKRDKIRVCRKCLKGKPLEEFPAKYGGYLETCLGCHKYKVDPKPTEGVKTYFIQHGKDGPIKIGKGKDPVARMRSCQTGNPVELVLLGFLNADVEQRLHRKFSHLRIRGEWFHPAKELLDCVEVVKWLNQ